MGGRLSSALQRAAPNELPEKLITVATFNIGQLWKEATPICKGRNIYLSITERFIF